MDMNEQRTGYRIGVDVGGTFTDLVVTLGTGHRTILHKLPSTPERPDRAIVHGIIATLEDAFHAAHEQQYGFASAAETIQFVNLKIKASGAFPELPVPRLDPRPEAAPAEQRETVFERGRSSTSPVYRRGELQSDVMDLILLNVRVPEERRGDYNAQIAANRLAARRCGQLVDKWTVPAIREGCRRIIEAVERRIRASVAALPDGEFRFGDVLDDDGMGTEGIDIRVRVEIAGERILFDFDGTAPQVRGNINVTMAGLQACCLYAMKALRAVLRRRRNDTDREQALIARGRSGDIDHGDHGGCGRLWTAGGAHRGHAGGRPPQREVQPRIP